MYYRNISEFDGFHVTEAVFDDDNNNNMATIIITAGATTTRSRAGYM